ncbi:outer membrane beta-barrel protein [Photobacterium lucens]|uniref:outer membrane beta-barrel protein n=1 Tax=Photobacterium lucens TaxID=2562949 RepID=UPI000D15661D|nr:outer membrane beta-barrel protein [Photobacterium lucens]MBP2702020.1 porin family protein [Vibrio parahaemolyticus]MZG57798.1 porin family protein [Photobacterium lucens]MZG79202.1 porin family protein [Photobacterium lucens]PSV21379.1 porin family protein [Photobacterium leiognathi subsp. mandapamensis]
MKKSLLSTLVLAGIVSAPAMATNVETFMGGGVGYQLDNFKGSHKMHSEDASYQIRGGIIVDDTHRLMATYGYKKDKFNYSDAEVSGVKAKHKQDLYLASYDYLVPVGANVNLFAGASMGAAHNKVTHKEGGKKSSTDFVWGGQVGAMVQLTDNISTDLTYRYLDQNYKAADTRLKGTEQIMWTLDYKF